MKGVAISNGTARAMLDQMNRGRRAELSILLGDRATAPGAAVDEAEMRSLVEAALSGRPSGIVAACARHVGHIQSTMLDHRLIKSVGLDPSVVAFTILAMGSLDVTAAGHSIHFSSERAKLNFDFPLGMEAFWSAGSDHSLYLGVYPHTVMAVVSERISEQTTPLREIVFHPAINEETLTVSAIRLMASGSTILKLHDHPATTWTPMAEIGSQAG